MLMRARQAGFTLIELVVALTIIAVMLLLGMPSMNSLFQNAKIGNAAQTLQAGVQLARAEAIRRNLPVEFVLSNVTTAVNSDATANSAAANPNGGAWIVRYVELATPADTSYHLIEAKAALEGSGQAVGSTPNVRVQGSSVAPAATFTGVITFNGLGGTSDGAEYRLAVDNPSGGACAPTGPMRCLQVRASPGGQVKICDPLAAAGDSRAC